MKIPVTHALSPPAVSHKGCLAQAARAAQWTPREEGVDLWMVRWDAGALARWPGPRHLAWLRDHQRARLSAIGDARLYSRYLWTQIWLGQVLSRYVAGGMEAIGLALDTKGKPKLELPGPSFSLSHSGDQVLVAVDPQGQSVGVDLEAQSGTRRLSGVVERFFSRSEQARFAQLDASAKVACFYRWWTAKEALAKAQGGGLSAALLALELPKGVLCPGTAAHRAGIEWAGQRWSLRDLGSYRGMCGALCQPHLEAQNLRTFWLSAQELA